MKTRSFFLSFTLMLLIFGTSCKEEQLDYTGVITFANSSSLTQIGDGISTVELIAHIAKGADPDKRTIVFSTDLGTFSNNTTTITIVADKDGNAKAYLKASVVGVATVKATVQSSYSATTNVSFTYASNVGFENAAAENLLADGYSTLKITAHVNSNVEADKRNLTFTTDMGTFTNGAATVVLAADKDGNASVYLRGDAVGTATVKVTVQTTSATKTVLFTQPEPDRIFKVETIADNVPSDGVSTISIPVTMNKDLPAASKKIVFSTDQGTFTNGAVTTTISADQDGRLVAYLRHNVPGPVHVSLTAGNQTKNLTLNFARAIPDFMLLTASPSITNGIANSLPVTISLKRNSGKPNADFLFDYKATDASGNEIGIFSNGSPSDQNGAASVTYTASETTYRGVVQITVSLKQYPAIKTSINVLVK